MKKRTFFAILSIALVFSMCIPAFAWSYPTTTPTNLMDLTDTAATPLYGIKTATPPTIDGTVDAVWATANQFVNGNYKISILWDETNVYLLEYRKDNEIVGTTAHDTITQWNPAFDMSLFVFATPATMENNKCAMMAIYVAPSTTLNGKSAGSTEASFVTMRKLLFNNIATGGQAKSWSSADADLRAKRETVSAYSARTGEGYLNEVSIPWAALCYANTAAAGDNNFTPALNDVVGFRAYYYQKGTGDSGNTAYTTDTGSDNGGFSPLNLVTEVPSNIIPINSVADFKDILTQAAGGNNYAGKIIQLNTDIDLNPGWSAAIETDGVHYTLPDAAPYEWPEIPTFAGTIDGNGHTLSGLYFEKKVSAADAVAPIINLSGSLKNLAIVNSLVCATHENGRNGNLPSGCKIGGIAGNLKGAAVIENVYLDMNVWAVSYSAQNIGGVVGYIPENGATLTNVVIAGMVGSSKPGAGAQDVNSSEGCRASGFAGNANWKTGVLLDQVVLASKICLNEAAKTASPAYGANNKFSTGDMYRKPSNCVAGRFATFAEATEEAAVLNTAETATNTYVYSPKLGGIAPASVVHMFDYNLAVQQTTIYEGTKSDNSKANVIDIRLLTVVNDLNVCEKIGFKVTVRIGSAEAVTETKTTNEVYSSVVAAGATVTAAEIGGKYICALVLKGVSATENVTITVVPVKCVGENTYEDPDPYAVSVVAGVIQ